MPERTFDCLSARRAMPRALMESSEMPNFAGRSPTMRIGGAHHDVVAGDDRAVPVGGGGVVDLGDGGTQLLPSGATLPAAAVTRGVQATKWSLARVRARCCCGLSPVTRLKAVLRANGLP